MSSLAVRLDALEARGKALRNLSRPLFLLGACLGIVAFVVIWPDKSAGDVLHSSRLLVPAELAQSLRQGHFSMYQMRGWDIWPGQQGVRILFGLLAVALALIWSTSGLFLKSWSVRSSLIVFGWPIVLVALSHVADTGQRIMAVGFADVSARAGQVTPSRMSPIMGDQARFVLAQQAYHEGKPTEVASQLRAMTGQWQPKDELTKTITGVLSDYAGAHGENAGALAADIAGGRPYQGVRFHLTRWSMRLAALFVLAGLAADFIGIRRQRSVSRMRSLLAELRETSALPASSNS